jgi:hypothetical protein
VKKIKSPSCVKTQVFCGLLLGASFLFSPAVWSASCCGGAAAGALVLPKFFNSMYDLTFDYEQYNGFWNQQGEHLNNPPGSDLKQYRLTPGYALRINPNWQVSAVLPYVWNDNQYASLNSSTHGLGDARLSFWYEHFDDIKCVYKVNTVQDLIPAAYFGASLTLPTGVSPYDDVSKSFDITGRGFYRMDANMLLDKTIYPWGMTLGFSYGTHLQRDVNQVYGNFVAPYTKKLGDRRSASLSFSYSTTTLENLDGITYSVTYIDLQEERGTINGIKNPASGFAKQSVSIAVAYSTEAKDWTIKASFNHSLQRDGWGKNFPATDTLSLGVSYVIP